MKKTEPGKKMNLKEIHCLSQKRDFKAESENGSNLFLHCLNITELPLFFFEFKCVDLGCKNYLRLTRI